MSQLTAGRGQTSLVVRLGLSALLLIYLSSRIDTSQMPAALRELSLGHALLAIALYVGAQIASALRWSMVAGPVGFSYPRVHYVRLYFEGMFVNLCLPSTIGGDLLKSVRLGDSTPNRILAGFTVLADRVVGVAALLVLALSVLARREFKLTPGPTLLVGLGLLVAALAMLSLVMGFVRWFAVRLPPGHRMKNMSSKLIPYQARPQLVWKAVAASFLVQFMFVLSVACLGVGVGIDVPSSAYLVAVPLISLAAMLPLTISGIGIREYGLSLLLASYGVTHDQTLALGTAWFAVIVVAAIPGGATYLLGSRTRRLQANQQPMLPPVESTIEEYSLPEPAESMLTPLRIRQLRKLDLRVSIVVPVYNEVENIPRLYAAICAAMAPIRLPFELLLVDDGSTDGSADVMERLADQDPNVKLIQFRRNFGQTAAMQAGLRMATGDVIVTIDADLQNDPADIPLMIEKLAEGYDLVHGWRKQRHDAWLNRKLPSKIANWLISKTTRFPVHDLGCTLKAMRREVADDLQLYGEMHRFIPILAHARGARCVELVTRHHPRRHGVSKYGLSRTFRVVLDLITVKYMIHYLASPMKLFGGMGLASLGVAMLSGLATLAMKLLLSVDMTGNPLLLLTVFAGFVGMQFFVLGMLGELGARTYYESGERQPYAIRRVVNLPPVTEDESRIHLAA